jgi:hypothetical protein
MAKGLFGTARGEGGMIAVAVMIAALGKTNGTAGTTMAD